MTPKRFVSAGNFRPDLAAGVVNVTRIILMAEIKTVEDERGKALQAVGWRLMENAVVPGSLFRECYWLSPEGEKFRSLNLAWKHHHRSQSKVIDFGVGIK